MRAIPTILPVFLLVAAACGSSPKASAGAPAAQPPVAIAPPAATASSTASSTPADRAPTGDPACDRYALALRAALACEPKPSGMQARLEQAQAEFDATLREVPPTNAAWPMVVDGCRQGADGISAGLVELGCPMP